MAFFAAFLPAAAASLIWVYSQPPEYRAVARLQISPAAGVAQATEAKDAPAVVTDVKSFLTEVQVLTSRPLLQDVIDRLQHSGELPDLGPDPVAAAQVCCTPRRLPVRSWSSCPRRVRTSGLFRVL